MMFWFAPSPASLNETIRLPLLLFIVAEALMKCGLVAIAAGAARKRQALARILAKTEKKYRNRLAAAQQVEGDDDAKNVAMHSARKAAKRARYTAELGIPALGKSARKARKRAKAVQGRLGDLQDAVIATGFLRRLGAIAGTNPGENGFTYGLLLGAQLERGHIQDT